MGEKRCMRCGHGPGRHGIAWGRMGWGVEVCEDGQRAAWALPLKPEGAPCARCQGGGEVMVHSCTQPFGYDCECFRLDVCPECKGRGRVQRPALRLVKGGRE